MFLLSVSLSSRLSIFFLIFLFVLPLILSPYCLSFLFLLLFLRLSSLLPPPFLSFPLCIKIFSHLFVLIFSYALLKLFSLVKSLVDFSDIYFSHFFFNIFIGVSSFMFINPIFITFLQFGFRAKSVSSFFFFFFYSSQVYPPYSFLSSPFILSPLHSTNTFTYFLVIIFIFFSSTPVSLLRLYLYFISIFFILFFFFSLYSLTSLFLQIL